MATKYIINNVANQNINGNISLSGNSDYVLSIRGEDDSPWSFGLFNSTYDPDQSVFAGWIGNDGQTYIGNEIDSSINIYNDADYYNPKLKITSSSVTVTNDLIVNGNLVVTGNTSLTHRSFVANVYKGYFDYIYNTTMSYDNFYSLKKGETYYISSY